MEGAQTIRAWRQIYGSVSSLARLQQHLHGDVRRAHRAGETEATVMQWPHSGCRCEGELDVLLEVAFVVDVAGGTMSAARQLGEGGYAELGTAAVGAEQIPLHSEKPDLHGGEASLDRRPRRNAEIVCQRLGFEMGEIGCHAFQHNVGDPCA